jgi:hypothetical protein
VLRRFGGRRGSAWQTLRWYTGKTAESTSTDLCAAAGWIGPAEQAGRRPANCPETAGQQGNKGRRSAALVGIFLTRGGLSSAGSAMIFETITDRHLPAVTGRL